MRIRCLDELPGRSSDGCEKRADAGLKFTTSPTAGSLDTDTLPRAQCGRMRAARFRAHARGMAHAPPMATTVAIIYVPSVCLAPLVNYV